MPDQPRFAVARGAAAVAALLVALVCAWTVAGAVASEQYETTVVSRDGTVIPTGATRSPRFEQRVRITWQEPDGSLVDQLIEPLADVGEGDRLVVTRSRLTGDVLVIDGSDGRLVEPPFPTRIAVVLLVSSTIVALLAAGPFLMRGRVAG